MIIKLRNQPYAPKWEQEEREKSDLWSIGIGVNFFARCEAHLVNVYVPEKRSASIFRVISKKVVPSFETSMIALRHFSRGQPEMLLTNLN
jgi:hypothetical protein